jgi:septal ring factor EnvC (AmiA/AmiB activator)
MNAAHTPTPRTDAQEFIPVYECGHFPPYPTVSSGFARQLERELAELRSKYRDHYEEAERLTREITDSRRSVKYSQDLVITLRCEKDEAMRQRDTLADALRALKELGPPSKAKDIITKALATLEGRGE